MVMAQSLFKLLRSRHPDHAIDVLAPAWSLPIVARMPEIRTGLPAETGHGEIGLRKRRGIAKTISASNYERAIILPRSFKAALIPWFARIPVRTGYRGESRYFSINDVRIFDPQILNQTVKRFAALGLGRNEALPTLANPSLSVSSENQQRLLESLPLDTKRPVVAMMPGAEYGPAKCWPLDYFARLAAQLEESGYAVWVLGSNKDKDAGNEIAASTGAINLCGVTMLADAIDLLALCESAVSNDSGLMHLAGAVGVHIHAIYGSSSPDFTPPLTARCDIHYLQLDCSPCFARECPLKHLNCLKQIAPEDVYARLV